MAQKYTTVHQVIVLRDGVREAIKPGTEGVEFSKAQAKDLLKAGAIRKESKTSQTETSETETSETEDSGSATTQTGSGKKSGSGKASAGDGLE